MLSTRLVVSGSVRAFVHGSEQAGQFCQLNDMVIPLKLLEEWCQLEHPKRWCP